MNLDDYHVFLTGYDDFDLRVSEQTAAGFLVTSREPTAKGRFSWRLVARRKDIAGPRFERVTIPQEPVLPDLPQVTELAPPQ